MYLIHFSAQQAIAQSAKATSEAQATQAAIAAAQHQAAQQTLTKAAADAASAATTAMGLMGSLGNHILLFNLLIESIASGNMQDATNDLLGSTKTI